MNSKRFNKNFDEIDRKSKVKMHKSGKNWVRTVMSQLNLLRVIRGQGQATISLPVIENSERLDRQRMDYLKAVLASGAAITGTAVTTAFAEEQVTVMEQEAEETVDTVVNQDYVVIETVSTEIVDEASLSISESLAGSLSQSLSLSQSIDTSLSISLSLSEVESQSSSISASESASFSASESSSMSASESHSSSLSASESASLSLSSSEVSEADKHVSASETTSESTSSTSIASVTVTEETSLSASTSETSETSSASTETKSSLVSTTSSQPAPLNTFGVGQGLSLLNSAVAGTATASSEVTTALLAASLDSSSSSESETAITTTTDRVVDINYSVKYVEVGTGKVVKIVEKNLSVNTAEEVALEIVEETAELPEGYVLSSSQSEQVRQALISSQDNVLTFYVEKDLTLESSAKIELQQLFAEGRVLAGYTNTVLSKGESSESVQTSLSTLVEELQVAETALLTADVSDAHYSQLATELRTDILSLAQALMAYTGDDSIAVALNLTSSSTLKVGEGEGVLVDTLSTASPAMTDANGAKISNPTNSTGFTPSSESERFTFNYSKLNWFGDQLTDQTIKENYYFRYSLDYDSSTITTYVELVNKTTNTVVESHTLDKGQTATFTYFQNYSGADNKPLTITYGDSTSSSTTTGELQLQYNGGTLTNTLVPTYQLYTTYYKTTDGTTIATYSMMGIGGQMATPSGVRTFTGYDYARTTGGTAVRLYSPGTIYNDGAISTSYIKRLAEVVDENGSVVKTIWVKDPTYTGTVDYNSTDTTGFIKVMETSVMAPGTANTSLVVPVTDIISAEESALVTANAQAGKSGNDIFAVIYEDNYQTIRIGFDGYAKAAKSYPVSMLVQVILKSGHPDYAPSYTDSAGQVVNPNTKGSSVNLANTLSSNTVNETTHWYTVDTSESTSLSTSNSLSQSESASSSASTSASTSASEYTSTSASTSASESASMSASTSASISASESASASASTSASESASTSASESASTSASESASTS
ncbi:TPA: accessory Sec-dependent serine-rich glycoprotein adhesin, partial [Streptococcus suis]